MILIVDLGNTDIVFGLRRGGEILSPFRMSSVSPKTADEIGVFVLQMLGQHSVQPSQVTGVTVCSVVPDHLAQAVRFAEEYLGRKPVVIHTGMPAPVRVTVDVPAELGTDRFANAVAGFVKFGGPLIVVDFGSATTITAVTAAGELVGGTIMPGLKTSAQALSVKAARLPFIPLTTPETFLGKNTLAAMQSGIVHGHAGAVSHLVAGLRGEPGLSGAKVVATGGLSALLAPLCLCIDSVEPLLTLEGIGILGEMAAAAERGGR